MLQIRVAPLRVLDQEEALDFYVNKMGFEVATDIKQGNFRWLTVRVPGDEGIEIFLEKPGAPAFDESTGQQIRDLVAKGALGGFVLYTDDCRKLYETLKARGITDFPQEPMERPYGVDMAIRDPFGNHWRVLEQRSWAKDRTREEAGAAAE